MLLRRPALGMLFIVALAPTGARAQVESIAPVQESTDGPAAPTADAPDDALGPSATDGPSSEPADVPTLDESPGPEMPTPEALAWTLERVVVRGNNRTERGLILRHVPVEVDEALSVDDARLDEIRYRLLGTGFFDTVELSLERGSERGRVVLAITVRERNTFLLEQVAIGASEGLSFGGTAPRGSASGQPYFGVSAAETNLAGTGSMLRGMLLLSAASQGVRVRFDAPRLDLGGSDLGLTLSAFFVRGEEYFGSGDDVLVTPLRCEAEGCDPGEELLLARIRYHRGGGTAAASTFLAPSLRFSGGCRLDVVDLLERPVAASELIGTEVVPIDFGVRDRTSFVSALVLELTYDGRDAPVLPTDGILARIAVDGAHRVLGSSYDYLRVEGFLRGWIPLGVPFGGGLHTLRLGFFGGFAAGDVPFFARFYAADLSDLVPNRWLEVNLDRRATPNLLRNVIGEYRFGRIAARVDAEYALRLFSLPSGVRSLWIYGLAGAYVLTDPELLGRIVPGYDALSSFPIDLTFDIGLRLETDIGVFELGFSTLLGLIRP